MYNLVAEQLKQWELRVTTQQPPIVGILFHQWLKELVHNLHDDE